MKKIFFIVSICSLFFIAGCGSTSSIPVQAVPTTPTVTQIPTVTPTPTPAPSGYTTQDVKQHNTPNDCRTVINGNIYDMSAFASRHSGGTNPIISICGKDGTSVYTQQHYGASLIQNFFVANLQ
ncbi:MAG: cytochrome b5-like heme/steroid binding domain-containing protein [Candidatus Absconditabacterales bacterium]